MRILFMGTPKIAKEALEELVKYHQVIGVFTNPDRPKDRGYHVAFSEVKQFSLENNLKVFQPLNLKGSLEIIKELSPQLIVVVAYGKILPKEILEIPKLGCINVHTSLLPKYRGAAPIHAPILEGDGKTGVTIMYMNEKMDEGDIILQEETPIYDEDNYSTLYNRLSNIGSKLLIKTIHFIDKGRITRVKQDHSKATYTKMIKKDDSIIDWNKSAKEIFNLIKAYNPILPAKATLNDNEFKIYETKIIKFDQKYLDKKIGEVVELSKEGPIIKTGENFLILTKIKPANKSILSGKDIINGKYIKIGEIFK